MHAGNFVKMKMCYMKLLHFVSHLDVLKKIHFLNVHEEMHPKKFQNLQFVVWN